MKYQTKLLIVISCMLAISSILNMFLGNEVSRLRQDSVNNLDPTTLEQALSKELNASDTYDVEMRYWADNLTSDISFTIKGKATPIKIDWSKID